MARLLVVDTETGGLDPAQESLLSLAAVVLEDGEIVDTLSIYINEPEIIANPKALEINGIDLDKVREVGMSPSDAVNHLEFFIRKYWGSLWNVTLGGHNVSFDVGFLRRLYRLAGRKYPFTYRVVCSQTGFALFMYAGKFREKPTSLNSACAHYGITIREGGVSGAHNALEDAIASAKLITKLVEEINAAAH